MLLERPSLGLRYFAPSQPLRGLISSYYVFHADVPRFSDLMRADLPQIRFMVRGSAHYQIADGESVQAPMVTLLGPTYRATRFDVQGPLLVFGVGLLPAGWAALVREDASLFANCIADASRLVGRTFEDLLEMLANVRTSQAVDLLDRVFRGLFAGTLDPPLWLTRTTEQWLSHSPSPQVDDLVAALGISSRQVERLVRRVYGGTPKLLARKYRTLKIASEMNDRGASWQEVAGDAYSDQSHLIREFRQFTGMTPRQLVGQSTPVTRLTFERRKLIGTLPELTSRT